jgi:hypothetical protein
MTDNERAFLIGLEKLTRETGVAIGGCGCCGSPSLFTVIDIPPEAGYAHNAGECEVRWISPHDDVYWEEYREKIVKPF